MTVALVLAIALLGGVAAVARFALDGLVERGRAIEFPLGTFIVNVLGSFLLGLLIGAGVRDDAMLLAGTATLGSFTTFSTWIFETHRLAEDGELSSGAANIVLSLGAGVGAALLGRLLGEGLR
jgi:fluoride exporter